MWRPKDWKKPDAIALKGAKPGLVMLGQVRFLTEKEVNSFEAGADAMLEALRSKGLKVSNIAFEHQGNGVVVFIPEEE
jgi:hypothetical protein